MHGFVEKAGPLDPKQWQVGFKEWRQNRTQDWVVQRQAQLAAGEQGGWHKPGLFVTMLLSRAILFVCNRGRSSHLTRYLCTLCAPP